MSDKFNILSTKALNLSQITIIDESKFNLTSTDFINITPIKFNIESLKSDSKNWIITSKNSLDILLNSFTLEELQTTSFFCVGDKTSQIISDNKLNLVESKHSSKELGEIIVRNHSQKSFSLIAGTLRRDELPTILTSNNVKFSEFTIYETELVPYKIEEQLNGILILVQVL